MYIHIGLPKTGTTSLQALFRRNRGLLRRRGVVYPDTTGSNVGNATPAAFALLGDTPAYFRASHPRYDAERLDFETCWHALIAEAQPGRALLASSEELGAVPPAQLLSATSWDRLEKHILVYLRRQDRALEASYRQEVRTGLFTGSIDDYVDEVILAQGQARAWFHYRRLITELWDAFGRERVHAFIYEERQAREWLFETALGALGLTLDSEYQVPDQRNPSLHPLFVEYLRRRLIDGNCEDEVFYRVFELALEPALTSELPTGLMSRPLRERVRAHFEAENSWLATALGAATPGLFADTSYAAQFVPEEHEDRFDRLERAVALRAGVPARPR